jgi:hypothetical protein
MEEWRYSSTILDFGTRWRRVIIFTPQPLKPGGRSPRNPLNRRTQSPSRCCGVQKSLSLARNRTSAVQPYPVAISTELSWILISSYCTSLDVTLLHLLHIMKHFGLEELVSRNWVSISRKVRVCWSDTDQN